MSKQKHRYKVGQDIWFGDHFAKVLKRLDNNEYQISFSTWDRDLNIKVVKESKLSTVGYAPHLNELRPL